MQQGLLNPQATPGGQPAPGPQGQPAPAPRGQPTPGGNPLAPGGQPLQDGENVKGYTDRDYKQNPLGPEDEAELEKFIIDAQKLIHSPQSRDTVLGRIGKSEKGPLDDISDLTVLLVDRIDQRSVKETGRKVDDAVKIQGANVVTGEIINISEAAGKIPKLSDDEKAVAFSHAVQKYTNRMVEKGDITREELAKYAQQAKNAGVEKGDINLKKMEQAGAAQQQGQTDKPTGDPVTGGARPMSEVLAERGGLLNG